MGLMLRKFPHVGWLAVPLACLLYLARLDASGLLGPDEPRYAAVARQMASSGDWVTPRLWGEPWFEKPALLYWMTGAAFRLGFGPELAPRLPVALLGVAFLLFYWWILAREFGAEAAWFSTLILGTSVGWVAFSQIGVTDLPMTVLYAAAMLIALPWISKGDPRPLPAVAILLGLAALAKGLVPLVLALPLLLRGRIREYFRWRVIVPFLLAALPWYLLCYLHNGSTFLDVFFWQHHFGRFTSAALQHGQPWWFYLPILLAGLLPWTPLALFLPLRHSLLRDRRLIFLLVWVLFGLLFFSAATNKLPGYVLPLLPAACALMGIGLAAKAIPRIALPLCALLLIVFPIGAHVLPQAVAVGLWHALPMHWNWTWFVPAIAAAGIWLLVGRGRRVAAVTALAASAGIGFLYLKAAIVPEVGRAASARGVWREIEAQSADVCVDSINRTWRYGLNYYSVTPLPDCSQEPKALSLHQTGGMPPELAPAVSVDPPLPRVVPSPR